MQTPIYYNPYYEDAQAGAPNLGNLHIPKGPRTQILRVVIYNINSTWALKPYYLGPWTRRVYVGPYFSPILNPSLAARLCLFECVGLAAESFKGFRGLGF